MIINKKLGVIGATLVVTSFLGAAKIEAASGTWQGNQYMKADGTKAQSEWIKDQGSWYYIKDNGNYASDEWIGDYYCNYWGDMAQDEWIYTNNHWYYLKSNGQYASEEWVGDYYLKYWGDMAQDEWIYTNNHWYYLKSNGQYASDEWIGDYYCNYWGDMAVNQWVGKYYVGSDGKWDTSIVGEPLENTDFYKQLTAAQKQELDEQIMEELAKLFNEQPEAQNQAINNQTNTTNTQTDTNQNQVMESSKPQAKINFNKQIDMQQVNTYFIELLNEERQKLGEDPVNYQPKLQAATMTRAKEISQSFSHTRPNGNKPYSAIDSSLANTYFYTGENIAYASISLITKGDQNDLARKTAEYMYTVWKNSPGHYQVMTDNNGNEISVSVFESDGKVYGVLLIGGTGF